MVDFTNNVNLRFIAGDRCVFKKGFDQRAHFSELAHDTERMSSFLTSQIYLPPKLDLPLISVKYRYTVSTDVYRSITGTNTNHFNVQCC